jgi:hypothetical protein
MPGAASAFVGVAAEPPRVQIGGVSTVVTTERQK